MGDCYGRQVVWVGPTAVCSEAVPHGQHACGIVGSGMQRLRMVSGFVRSGLAAGDRVWCFPNGSRSEVLDWLCRDEVAADDALASGQLTVLPSHESALCALYCDPDTVIDGLREAVANAVDDGWNGFRMIGDLGRATRGLCCTRHLLDFEERVGDVLVGAPAATLCQYDRYRFDADTMVALTGVHAAVVGTVHVGEQLTCTPLDEQSEQRLAGLRLVGEADLANREVLASALDEAISGGTGDLHLELSELTFIDTGCVQVMLRSARRLWPGRRMVLHRPPRSLKIALDLLWDTQILVEATQPAQQARRW